MKINLMCKILYRLLLFLCAVVSPLLVGASARESLMMGECVDSSLKYYTDILSKNDSTTVIGSELKIISEVKDHLTHNAVRVSKAKLLRATDSSFVDTVEAKFYDDSGYKASYVSFKIKNPGNYILCVRADSFMTAFVPIVVKKIYKRELVRTIPAVFMRRLPKRNEMELDEVVVKPTKLRFYMDGDTLVYDADAFNLSEGSMINALLKKLPGVTLDKGGVIKVNGRKVDALLLNGKDFFDNNRELLLENMPAYMVNKIRSYERVPDRLRGTPMEKNARKELVMDVKLKRDYAAGWLYSADAGGGSTFFRNDEGKLDGKFLGRLFGMRYSDRYSLVAFVNANNLNDESRPGQEGEWSPFSQSGGLTTAYMGGIVYSSNKDGVYNYNGSLDGAYHEYDERNNTNAATFLDDGDAYSRSFFKKRSYEWSVSSNHIVNYMHTDNWKNLAKYIYMFANPSFSMKKWNNHALSASVGLTDDVSAQMGKAWMDSIMSPGGCEILKRYAINRNISQSKGIGHSVNESIGIMGSFSPAHNDYVSLSFTLRQSMSDEKNEQFEHYLLDYPATASASSDFRNKYMPVANTDNSLEFAPRAEFRLDRENIHTLYANVELSHSYSRSNNPIYLLHKLEEWNLSDEGRSSHPLGTLPSMEEMLKTQDRENSSLSRSTRNGYSPTLGFRRSKDSGDIYSQIELRLDMPVEHERLDYACGAQIDTLARRTMTFLNPSVSFYRSCYKSGFSLALDYSMSHSAPSMVNMFNIHNDSDPLNVTLGNPDLESSVSHSFSVSYNDRYGKANFNSYSSFNVTDNAVASGFVYNKETGVRTVKPQNVDGNWSANVGAGLDMPLIGDYKLSMNQSLSCQYVQSVDISGTDRTQASRSVVNTSSITESLSFIWRPTDKMEYELDGNVDYQNSSSRRADFSAIKAYTFHYGVKANVELPWGVELATDVTMYSRRGYSESSMNTNELVWNAHVSKKMPKIGLTLMFDGFDLLGNMSNVQRYVNAQGRTETFYNVIPSYGLFHVLWRPVSKKKAAGANISQ